MKGIWLVFKKKVMALLLGALLVVGYALIQPALALINEDGRGVSTDIKNSFVGVKSAHQGREMGTFLVNGIRVVCIDTGKNYPTKTTTVTTKTDNPLAAFVMARYGNTTDDITAAAVWYIINIDAKLGNNQSWAKTGWNGSTHKTQLETKRQQILDTYNKVKIGNYTLKTSVVLTSGDASTGTAKYTITPTVSTAVTLTLSGPAVFTANNSKTITLKPGTTSAPFTATGNGQVKVSAKAPYVYQGSYKLFPAQASGYQRTVASGSLTPLTGNDPRGVTPSVPVTPSISTWSSARNNTKKVGQTITDTIYISGAKPDSTVQVEIKLYGPLTTKPTETTNAPTGTPLATTETVTISVGNNGQGHTITKPYRVTEAGWYTYDAHTTADTNHTAVDHGYGKASETGQVTKYTPQMSTVFTAAGVLQVGSVFRDVISITGGEPNSVVPVTVTAYGPLASRPVQSANAPAGTPVLGTQTIDVVLDGDGNGTTTSRDFTATGAGWYTFDAEFADTATYTGVDHGFGVPQESAQVGKYTPALATTSSARSNTLQVGQTLTDTISVTGAKPSSTVEVEVKLYGPLPSRPVQSANAPAGAPLVKTEILTVSVNAQGKGTATTKAYTATSAGWYTFDAKLIADASHIEVDHGYGVTAETGQVLAYSPRVATATSDQLVTGESVLTDTVSVTGGAAGVRFSGVTRLYGPFAADPSIPGAGGELLDLTVLTPVGVATFSGTYGSDGSATVTSSSLTVSKAGFYVWSEQLTAVPGVVNGTSPAAPAASETTLLVNPKIATLASDQVALPGYTLTDTVSVTGLVPEVAGKTVTYTVSGALYGPMPAVDGSCDTVDWAKAPVAKTITPFTVVPNAFGGATINGVGQYTIPEDTTGSCFTYGETLTATLATAEGDADKELQWTHAPGQATQTVLVVSPALSSQITGFDVGGKVEFGSTVSDQIMLTGLENREVPGSDTSLSVTASGGLFGPLEPVNGVCSGLDWSKAEQVSSYTDVVVPASGVLSDLMPTVLSESGCYSASATATVMHGQDVVAKLVHELGNPSQTVLVKKSSGGAVALVVPTGGGIAAGTIPSDIAWWKLVAVAVGVVFLASGVALLVRRRVVTARTRRGA